MYYMDNSGILCENIEGELCNYAIFLYKKGETLDAIVGACPLVYKDIPDLYKDLSKEIDGWLYKGLTVVLRKIQIKCL